jgi:type III secretion protein C
MIAIIAAMISKPKKILACICALACTTTALYSDEKSGLTEASIRELANTYLSKSCSSELSYLYSDENDIDMDTAAPELPYNSPPPYTPTLPSQAPYAVPAAPEQPYAPQMGLQQPGAAAQTQTSATIIANPPSTRERIYNKPNCGPEQQGYTVNFDDISVVQLIHFISKIAGTNFIFNSNDLQNINVTIVSEDPTSVSDLSAALMQILKMHNLSVTEEGNNVLIYPNKQLSRVSTVITNDNANDACDKAVITRVFQLYNVDPIKIANIVNNLVSPEASVQPSPETRHLVVTDITANVNRIADLLAALDNSSDIAPSIAKYQVKNADAAILAEYAQSILSPLTGGTIFSITPERASRTIFIVGVPYIIDKAIQILESLDVGEIASLAPPPDELLPSSMQIQNNSLFMYKLKYTNGADIANALHEVGINLQATGVGNPDFINTIFSIQWIDVNNSLVIAGTPDAIEKVVTLVDDLDVQPKQVYIEVLILDTTLSNSIDFGVQWIALGEEQNRLAFGTGLLANAPPAPNLQAGARAVAMNINPATGQPPAIPNPGTNVALPTPANLVGDVNIDPNSTEAFGLGILGNIIRHGGQSFLTLGALISALDEEGDTTIVLNPKIMVEDTQSADFFVGQNIPYQTTSTVIQQTGSVTQNIQYEDIGVQLQVTPTISPDNMVTLQINQAVSTVLGTAGATNLTPVTNKTLATTRVHVPDGTFLVMSGHIQEDCTYIRSGIPCLGTLPLIGPTFSRTIEIRDRRNLIFFIRPKVVTNIQQGLDVTNMEGYQHNWDSNPCSLIESCCPDAPEMEIYPSPNWPVSPGAKERPLKFSLTPGGGPNGGPGGPNGGYPPGPNGGPNNGNGYGPSSGAPAEGDEEQTEENIQYWNPSIINGPPPDSETIFWERGSVDWAPSNGTEIPENNTYYPNSMQGIPCMPADQMPFENQIPVDYAY